MQLTLNKIPKFEQVLMKSVSSTTEQASTALHSDRSRYKRIDKDVYYFIQNTKEKQRDSESASNKEEKESTTDSTGLPLDIPVPDPLTMAQGEDLIAYLSNLYLASDPLFPVPMLPNQMHVTRALENVIRKDSNAFNWRLELLKSIQNSVWYNSGPLEIVETPSKKIKLKAIDPNNLLRDPNVSIDQAHTHGTFIGYIEEVTVPNIYEELKGVVNKDHLLSTGKSIVADVTNIVDAAIGNVSGHITPHRGNKYSQCADGYTDEARGWSGSTDWSRISVLDGSYIGDDGKEESKEEMLTRGVVTRKVIYRKAEASWLGLPTDRFGASLSVDDQAVLPVYKIVSINDTPIIAFPVTTTEGTLPLFTGQIYVDTTHETPYSFADRLTPVQQYAAKLTNARILAIRESLKEDKIANLNYVEEGSLDQPIKRVKRHASADQFPGIDQVYRNQQRNVSGIASLVGTLQDVSGFAQQVSGNNLSLQGGHVPGNRSLPESQRLLTTSEGRFRLKGIVYQNTMIEPMQQLLAVMYGFNVGRLEYFDNELDAYTIVTQGEYTILKDQIELSDGLLPAPAQVSPDIMTALLTTVTQIPDLQQSYDLRDLFELFAVSGGFKDIGKVRRPHTGNLGAQGEQQQAQQGQEQQAQGQEQQAQEQQAQAQPQDPAQAQAQAQAQA